MLVDLRGDGSKIAFSGVTPVHGDGQLSELADGVGGGVGCCLLPVGEQARESEHVHSLGLLGGERHELGPDAATPASGLVVRRLR